MAQIDIERKSTTSWIWWVLGLILLALVVWWIVSAAGDDTEVAEAPGVVAAPVTPEPVASAPGVSIADILGTPTAYVGQAFAQSNVRVAEVPSDRGFWIEDGGSRLFAILVDEPTERPDINPGQTLSISQGMLRDRTFLPDMQGAPLDAETRRIAESQPLFLVVDQANLTIDGRPTP